MNTDTHAVQDPILDFEAANWISMDCMSRDREQSRRLHEPTHLASSIDPITGNDIHNREEHPHLDDGNLTVYFESAATQKAYLATPFNHPYPRLSGKPVTDQDRGG